MQPQGREKPQIPLSYPTTTSELRLGETQKVMEPDACPTSPVPQCSCDVSCGPSPMTLIPEGPSPLCTEIKTSLALKHLQAGT